MSRPKYETGTKEGPLLLQCYFLLLYFNAKALKHDLQKMLNNMFAYCDMRLGYYYHEGFRALKVCQRW